VVLVQTLDVNIGLRFSLESICQIKYNSITTDSNLAENMQGKKNQILWGILTHIITKGVNNSKCYFPDPRTSHRGPINLNFQNNSTQDTA
jgi:hypothetical protein